MIIIKLPNNTTMTNIRKDFSTLLRIEAIKAEIMNKQGAVKDSVIRSLLCELVEETQKLTK